MRCSPRPRRSSSRRRWGEFQLYSNPEAGVRRGRRLIRDMGQPSPASHTVPAPVAHGRVMVNGVTLHADCLGALYWPDEGALIVADLHLEKGSSFARRGQLLPPYDTAETLARLARLIAHHAPRTVIALGDNFHDGGGPNRPPPPARAGLAALQRGRDWIWIAGNHDPEPAEGIGGSFAATISIGA